MKFSAAVIGLGVGEQHLKTYLEHSDCSEVFVFELDRVKLTDVLSRFQKVKTVNSLDEIYNNPDIKFISIASYDNFHREQIVHSLKSGKHVFCEKPICQFEEELHDIAEQFHKAASLQLSSNLILRKCPRFIELKNDIQNGVYGQIYHIEADYLYGRIQKILEGWRGSLPFYSIIGGGGVHLVDLVSWLTGEWPIEVMAMGNKICTAGTQFKQDDFVVALLKYNSGMIVKLSANFGCVQPHYHHLKIFGTKATFTNGRDTAFRQDSRDPQQSPISITSAYPGVTKGDYLVDFINSVQSGFEPQISAQEVFDVMSVCLAVEKACTSGQIEKIKYLRKK